MRPGVESSTLLASGPFARCRSSEACLDRLAGWRRSEFPRSGNASCIAIRSIGWITLLSWIELCCAVSVLARPEGEPPSPAAEHWAYRPLVEPSLPGLPEAADPSWARNPIDRFVLARLAERDLSPSPQAAPRTLVRRLFFDLTGLPPSPVDLERFLADEAPDAYERLVERLLASPRHGERWARHWMDLVHFAESHGHDQDRPRPNAWPYRDYLIRAFNRDLRYGRFIREQVAGDALFSDDPWAIVATGFLAAGPWDESSLRDIREDSLDREIGRYLDRDDIVSTVMSTFVSTTVHCARCHDHKFDPVSMADYYALQAVFAGIDRAEREFDRDPELGRRRRELQRALRELPALVERIDPSLLDRRAQAAVDAWEARQLAARRRWRVLRTVSVDSEGGATLESRSDGSIFSGGERPERDTYTVVAESPLERITGLRLEVLADEALPRGGPGRQDNGNLHLNELVVTALPGGGAGAAGHPLTLRKPRADFDQGGWTIAMAIDGDPATAWGIYPQVGRSHRAVFELQTPLERAARPLVLAFSLRQLHGGGHLIGRFRLSATSEPPPWHLDAELLPDRIAEILAVKVSARTPRQRSELAGFVRERSLSRQLRSLPPPDRVYCGTNRFTPDGSFRPAARPREVHVLERGDIRRPLELARPGTIGCVPGLPARFDVSSCDTGDSGAGEESCRRIALADWLADRRNVLTWRSIANRLWRYHFGRGMVDSPNDFGRMGQAPSHPELLDWLAVALRDSGGSLKSLDRLIVTSATYRQSAQYRAGPASVDSESAFLWRMPPRRLEAEEIRDASLQIAGVLDLTMGGPSVKQFVQTKGVHVTPTLDYLGFDVDDPANYRRSVYRFIFRTVPDPFMEAMDCPDASQLAPRRTESTTALQALAMLNDKLLVRAAERLAGRVERERAGLDERLRDAFERILSRPPRREEAAALRRYASAHGLENVCRVLFNSNEFIFVD